MHLKANPHMRYITKIGCGIAMIWTDDDFIQPQRFRGDYTLGDVIILELQPEAVDKKLSPR